MDRGIGSILIVEDNRTERLLIKEAFQELGVKDAVHILDDGEDAIAFLKGKGEYSDRKKFKFPTLLVTDLRMPRVNGFELLSFIKRSHLIIIPTIVLTASCDLADIKQAYLLGVNAFHKKPENREGFLQLLKNLHDYWHDVELPEIDENGNFKPANGTHKLGLNIRPLIG